MATKVLAMIEIDDEALDATQAKADKLLATLKEVVQLTERLTAKEKPPEGGKIEDRLDPRCWDIGTRAAILGLCTKEHVAQNADKFCEFFDKHLRRIAQATSQPQERRCTRE